MRMRTSEKEKKTENFFFLPLYSNEEEFNLFCKADECVTWLYERLWIDIFSCFVNFVRYVKNV